MGTRSPDYTTCNHVQIIYNKKSLEVHMHVKELDYYNVVIGIPSHCSDSQLVIFVLKPPRQRTLYGPVSTKDHQLYAKTPEEA